MKIVWKYFAGSLLALLGFSSCRQIGFGREEYGQPHADFKLIGDVRDAAGEPVEGIRVVADPTENEEKAWYNDTTYTDARGHFEVERLRYSWPDNFAKGQIKFEDVDGDQNGSYRTKVLKTPDIKVTQTKKGDGRWYDGAFTITADATLEKDE